MSKEEITYISLYDYLGRSTAKNQEGFKVASLAMEKGIKPKFKLLPEGAQTDDYKSVATYPIDFLDSIYKRSEQNLVRKDELDAVLQKVKELEEKLNKLLNVTNKHEPDTDDLPF
tara:strand:+ start:165 stop:509 length:345 start_codon:yes stop_codon:yes gene_type:complete